MCLIFFLLFFYLMELGTWRQAGIGKLGVVNKSFMGREVEVWTGLNQGYKGVSAFVCMYIALLPAASNFFTLIRISMPERAVSPQNSRENVILPSTTK